MTDGTNILAVDNGSLSLPSHNQWPTTRPIRKSSWPQYLMKHITFEMNFEWNEYKKPKRAFGLDKNSSWAIFEITSEQLQTVVKFSKRNRNWWIKHGFGKPEWALRSLDMSRALKVCDVNSAQCVAAYLQTANGDSE